MEYYFEYEGGLGDIFYQMFQGQSYGVLETMTEQDRAEIVLITHNPFVKELFKSHPNASSMLIRDLGYWPPEKWAEMRAQHSLLPKRKLPHRTGWIPRFYPPDSELELLASIDAKRCVVFSVTAGLPGRSLPHSDIELLTKVVQKSGFNPVFVGRSYSRFGRAEYHPYPQQGIDLVDKLSVPGVATLVSSSRGLVCAHSSVNILAWLLRKPQLLLYPESVLKAHIEKRDQWAFGIEYPECKHSLFGSESLPSLAEDFAAGLQRD